jgi:hypothetical protein
MNLRFLDRLFGRGSTLAMNLLMRNLLTGVMLVDVAFVFANAAERLLSVDTKSDYNRIKKELEKEQYYHEVIIQFFHCFSFHF